MNGGAEELRGQRVSPEFFRLLGIHAELGRVFAPEDALPGQNDVIILGYGIWQRLFGGDPGIIGRVLDISNRPIRVIGVLPADFHPFRMSNPGEVPQVFRPFQLAALESNDYEAGVTAVASLKPGVTLGAARADLNQIARDLAREYGNNRARNSTLQVELLYNRMTGTIRTAVLVLFGAAGFVLLIACTNVASLLLTRASGRATEIAVRAALGCGRWRLTRQLLTESLLLALAGGAAGVLLARPAVAALLAAAPPEIPRVDEIRIDTTVLLLELGATLASGVLFGVAPAFRLWRADLNEMLRGYRDLGRGRGARRMRAVLVVAEIACAFLLAFGGSLLSRSVHQLFSVNPGYDSHHIFTMTAFGHDQDTDEKRLAYFRHLVERIRALPGIESAAMVSTPPLAASVETTVYAEGKDSSEARTVDLAFATPDYFRVMKIPLLEGRPFSDHDDLHSQPVSVISQSCARLLYPHGGAVGHVIQSDGLQPHQMTVVGVVGDVWQHGMDAGPSPGIYIPQAQRPDFFYRLFARTTGDPWRIYPAVRSVVHDLNPREPLFHVQPMDDYVTKSMADRILLLWLAAALGAIALLLAAVGTYGVISYNVSLRTREIGVRMALGAGRRAVIGLVLRDLLVTLVYGLACGLIAALALNRLLEHLLYRVHPSDPIAIAAAATVVVAVSLSAAYLPCRRAAGIAPALALHHE